MIFIHIVKLEMGKVLIIPLKKKLKWKSFKKEYNNNKWLKKYDKEDFKIKTLNQFENYQIDYIDHYIKKKGKMNVKYFELPNFNKKKIVCKKCNKKGHLEKNCRYKYNFQEYCLRCEKKGHSEINCYAFLK
jgi:hypothetical protein